MSRYNSRRWKTWKHRPARDLLISTKSKYEKKAAIQWKWNIENWRNSFEVELFGLNGNCLEGFRAIWCETRRKTTAEDSIYGSYRALLDIADKLLLLRKLLRVERMDDTEIRQISCVLRDERKWFCCVQKASQYLMDGCSWIFNCYWFRRFARTFRPVFAKR